MLRGGTGEGEGPCCAARETSMPSVDWMMSGSTRRARSTPVAARVQHMGALRRSPPCTEIPSTASSWSSSPRPQRPLAIPDHPTCHLFPSRQSLSSQIFTPSQATCGINMGRQASGPCTSNSREEHITELNRLLRRGSVLDSVLFRVGVLAGLRSKKLDGKTVGVMVTASHNPEDVSHHHWLCCCSCHSNNFRTTA